jgi:cytoskeleton protein RodZ
VFEIGSSLREARIRQGYDLVEAEAGTKIRSKYLGALEEERFEVLPAPMYVKGFLRSYSEFLGLDGQLYVDEYNTRYGSGDEEYVVSRPQRVRRRQSRAHRRFESRVLALALVGIVAAAALVVAAWKWGGTEAGTVANLDSRKPSVETASTSTTPARKKPPVTLVLNAVDGNSQLQVHRGSTGTGAILFQGTLERGHMLRFTGRKLWLNVASPEHLRARLNGKAVLLSAESRPVVVVVTKKGVAPPAS